jgi:hypothetical protein
MDNSVNLATENLYDIFAQRSLPEVLFPHRYFLPVKVLPTSVMEGVKQ